MYKKIISSILALSIILSNATVITSFAAEDKPSVNISTEAKTIYKFKNLKYVIEDDNSVTIVGCDDYVTWVYLTGTINNRPIKKIDANAFSNCKNLSKITFGNDLEYIGASAFKDTKITDIVIPASVTFIGKDAFRNCTELKNVYAYIYNDTKKDKNKNKDKDKDKDNETNISLNAFKNTNKDLTIISTKDSPYKKYAEKNNIKFKENESYLKDKNTEEKSTTKQASKEVTDNHSRTTYQDYVNSYKYVKGCPEGLDDTSYTYHWDDDYYYFDRSGITISKDDYIILCNCVANEYGSNYINTWEMGLVAEVIFNRYYWWGYNSIRSVITAPNQFEGSGSYSGLDTFSYKVTDHVKNSVNTYLSFPEYFDEGYTSFRGDGRWNYFW